MTTDTEAVRQTDTIPAWKQEEVDDLVEIIEDYDSIGVVNITGIPSRQLQNMRADLYGTAQLRVSRNTLLIRAIEEVDEGLEELVPYIDGQVGLVGTDDNPFGLFRHLEESKTPAPINAGEVAPNDIVIPAGDTGVDPGPFVGELQQVGADARIDGGSIVVSSDSTVAETGEEVSAQLANVLNEMGIEPKEVGLDLRAVYADGVLFEPDELALDIDEYRSDVQAAAAAGRNLSVNAAVPTQQTVPMLLQKAVGEGKSLGLQASIENADLLPDLVSQADAHVRSLVANIDDEAALPDALQDLEPATPAEPEETDESTEEEEPAPEEGADEDVDDEDDDDAGAEGLGEMFG